MKRLILSAFASMICLNMFAITHSKPIDPVVITVNLPKEQVWQRVMDLFVANSIPIKLMDKSSGLIQSERIGLGSHYALKHADDSLAWALCETVKSPEGDSFYLFPQVINTELQVYVRETADGKVLLSLNLMNMMAASHDPNTGNDRDFAIQSTKRLENIIGNYLKTFEPMPNLAFDPPMATFGEPPSQVKRRAALAQKQAVQNQAKAKEEESSKTILTVLGIIALTALVIFGSKSSNEE
jgi:hypothetical protein